MPRKNLIDRAIIGVEHYLDASRPTGEKDTLRLILRALHQAKRDKEMLDWLSPARGFKVHHLEPGLLDRYYSGEFKTPRQAIRAAMKAEKEGR